jgi:hypothetical protein
MTNIPTCDLLCDLTVMSQNDWKDFLKSMNGGEDWHSVWKVLIQQAAYDKEGCPTLKALQAVEPSEANFARILESRRSEFWEEYSKIKTFYKNSFNGYH